LPRDFFLYLAEAMFLNMVFFVLISHSLNLEKPITLTISLTTPMVSTRGQPPGRVGRCQETFFFI